MEFLNLCVEKIPNAIDGVLNIWLFANTVRGGLCANVNIGLNFVILDSNPAPFHPPNPIEEGRQCALPLWYSAPISQELLPQDFAQIVPYQPVSDYLLKFPLIRFDPRQHDHHFSSPAPRYRGWVAATLKVPKHFFSQPSSVKQFSTTPFF